MQQQFPVRERIANRLAELARIVATADTADKRAVVAAELSRIAALG